MKMPFDALYQFFIENDQYVIYLHKENDVQRPLIIDRISQEVRAADYEKPYYSDPFIKPITIYGIIGTIQLLSGRFLITIDQRQLVGELLGHQIYKVTKISLHQFAKSTLHLNDAELESERTYVGMLSHVLQIEGFYFSHTYDLTMSQQRMSDLGPAAKSMTYLERADPNFLWNAHLLRDWSNLVSNAAQNSTDYARPRVESFVTPIIFGFVGILSPISVQDSSLRYAIISRRSVKRAGTRFYARGLDSNANAANTVETEQIVCLPPGHIFSFVQLRGSVPLFWSQRPNLKYKPNVRMGRLSTSPTSLSEEDNEFIQVPEEQTTIIQRHFYDTCYLRQYGRSVVINLLDHKGMERRLCRTFALAAQSVNPDELKYESFDFHKECRALQWHRLSILLDRLEPEIVAMGQFHYKSPCASDSTTSNGVESTQNGVFRTNCIDCLDRTNVVQSMIARRTLELGLQNAHLVETDKSSDKLQPSNYMPIIWPGFEQLFKNIWADNADVCSVQYTGTKALKTDFTRTGKRTFRGMLMDGYHSAIRYYLNNFVDGYRQDAFNLLLGQFVVREPDGAPNLLPPEKRTSDSQLRSKFLPVLFAFATSMSVLCLIFPSEVRSEQLLYFLFWGSAVVTSAFTIYTYGDDYVNKPRFPME